MTPLEQRDLLRQAAEHLEAGCQLLAQVYCAQDTKGRLDPASGGKLWQLLGPLDQVHRQLAEAATTWPPPSNEHPYLVSEPTTHADAASPLPAPWPP